MTPFLASFIAIVFIAVAAGIRNHSASDMMAVATYTGLDGRMVEIEQKLSEQAR